MRSKITSIYRKKDTGLVSMDIMFNDIALTSKISNIVNNQSKISIEVVADCPEPFNISEVDLKIRKVFFDKNKNWGLLESQTDIILREIVTSSAIYYEIEEQFKQAIQREQSFESEVKQANNLLGLMALSIDESKKDRIIILGETYYTDDNLIYIIDADNGYYMKEGIHYRCYFNPLNVNPLDIPSVRYDNKDGTKNCSYYDIQKMISIKRYVIESCISRLINRHDIRA